MDMPPLYSKVVVFRTGFTDSSCLEGIVYEETKTRFKVRCASNGESISYRKGACVNPEHNHYKVSIEWPSVGRTTKRYCTTTENREKIEESLRDDQKRLEVEKQRREKEYKERQEKYQRDLVELRNTNSVEDWRDLTLNTDYIKNGGFILFAKLRSKQGHFVWGVIKVEKYENEFCSSLSYVTDCLGITSGSSVYTKGLDAGIWQCLYYMYKSRK